MNKIAKFVIGLVGVLIVVYFGWLVVKATFPVDVWFEENPVWRSFFVLIVIMSVIGLFLAILKPKGK